MNDTPTRHHRTGAGARINADHIVLYRLVVAGIIATAAAAIVTSWNGLIFVAEWQHLPVLWRPVTPIMIDVAIIVFTLGVLGKRSRGENLILLQIGAYGLTAISSTANFLHTVSISGLHDFEGYTGACLNALAPLLILLTTEVLGSLITKPKRIPRKKRRRSAPKTTAAVIVGTSTAAVPQ